MPPCTVLHCAALCCGVLQCSVQYYKELRCLVLYRSVLHCGVPGWHCRPRRSERSSRACLARPWPCSEMDSTVLCSTVVYRTAPCCAALRCDRVALAAASQREEFTSLVGTPVALGPWYNTTLGVSHGGRSVSATFPVTGPNGSAMVHARALRMRGKRRATP